MFTALFSSFDITIILLKIEEILFNIHSTPQTRSCTNILQSTFFYIFVEPQLLSTLQIPQFDASTRTN